MSLVINHNMMAANVARNLNTHYGKLAQSTQRLSTGLRVNSAADDAAGLAIRELQRADIAALHQGARNANDAISMIQTADAALAVIDEKLIRMKELAEQAATGTYDSTQRLMIQSEFAAMASEIERIANATDFNGIKILNNKGNTENINPGTTSESTYNDWNIQAIQYIDGLPSSFTNGLYAHWTFNGDVLDYSGNNFNGVPNQITYFGDPLKAAEFNGDDSKVTVNNFTIDTSDVTISVWLYLESMGTSSEGARQILATNAADNAMQLEIWGKTGQIMFDATTRSESRMVSHYNSFDLNSWNLITATKNGNTSTIYLNGSKIAEQTVSGSLQLNNQILNIGYEASRHDQTWDGAIEDLRIYNRGFSADEAKELYEKATIPKIDTNNTSNGESKNEIPDNVVKIHFGSGNDSAEDYYYINKSDATLEGLGLNGVSIETQDKAQRALDTINQAIVKKDNIRAYYGALQNRLENTITNITTQAENLQAAESRISDVDVATEMTEFVRQQILAQSAVAMLSQANSMPQMAMQLIGG